jgi:hypothetical protein
MTTTMQNPAALRAAPGSPALRDNESLRQAVAGRLAQVQSALDQLVVEVPRRRILRPRSTSGGSHAAPG